MTLLQPGSAGAQLTRVLTSQLQSTPCCCVLRFPLEQAMLMPHDAQASSALWLQVTLKCGATESLSRVQEPNRCEYTAVFATPAACTPALAAAVRDRLQSWDVHDEL